MSPQKVLWLFLQGFTIKYYLCEAERGDFIVNRQAPTLQKKDMTDTFATQFSSDRPKVDVQDGNVERYNGRI